jgi:predicted RNA-binding Zn-ribbon protein involved in translation (DUF1610 family)
MIRYDRYVIYFISFNPTTMKNTTYEVQTSFPENKGTGINEWESKEFPTYTEAEKYAAGMENTQVMEKTQDGSYIDTAIDEETVRNLKICESCGKVYDYRDEDKEVKEGGTYICPTCWAQPE